MKVEYVRTDKVDGIITVPQAENNLNQFELLQEYVGQVRPIFAIDPGTKSMGIVIGDYMSSMPMVIMLVTRGSESTPVFEKYVADLFLHLTKYMKPHATIIENQFLKFKTAYSAVKSMSSTIKGIMASLYQHPIINPMPKEWMPVYLDEHPRFGDLNLNNELKKELYELGCMKINHLNFFKKNDTADAVGLFFYYMKVHRIMRGNQKVCYKLRSTTPMSLIDIAIAKTSSSDVQGLVEAERRKMLKKYPDRLDHLQYMQFSDRISVEENIIKCSSNSDMIFSALLQPRLDTMGFIYKYNRLIGDLNLNDIYVLTFVSKNNRHIIE